MSSYWVSKWFCGKNTKQVHKERKQVDLQWFMVVQEFCVKKVARSQRAGQQWSNLKILLIVHGVTRFMCEKGRAVTRRWSAVEHRELIAGGGNWKAVGWWTQIASWTPQFFTEPDQPRSSQIFQDGETVIFSCGDTPEEAFQICCMTTTRNVVLLWSSLWFYSPFYLPIVTSSKCSIW